jgi:uncharacterized alpha-E superfamily protein
MGIDESDHLRVGQRAAPAVRDAVGDEVWSNSGRSQEQIRLSSSVPAPRSTLANTGDLVDHRAADLDGIDVVIMDLA